MPKYDPPLHPFSFRRSSVFRFALTLGDLPLIDHILAIFSRKDSRATAPRSSTATVFRRVSVAEIAARFAVKRDVVGRALARLSSGPVPVFERRVGTSTVDLAIRRDFLVEAIHPDSHFGKGEIMGLLDPEDMPAPAAASELSSRQEQAVRFLYDLTGEPGPDGAPRVFTNRVTKDGKIAKGMIRASAYILELLDGRFLSERWNLLNHEILRSMGVDRDLADEKLRRIVQDADGNLRPIAERWMMLYRTCLKAIGNYREAFREDRAPISKKSLTRDVTEFFFNQGGGAAATSWFLESLVPPPERAAALIDRRVDGAFSEAEVEQIIDFRVEHLPDLDEKGINRFRLELLRARQFAEDFRTAYGASLGPHSRDLFRNPGRFVTAWLEWLPTFRGEETKLSLGNLFVGKPTWALFLASDADVVNECGDALRGVDLEELHAKATARLAPYNKEVRRKSEKSTEP